MGALSRAKTALWLALLAAFAALPAAAQQFTFDVDVPSTLGASAFTPNQVAQYSSGTYSLAYDGSSTLGPAGHFSAITETAPGSYDLCVDVPTTISGTAYQPNDILHEYGGIYSLVQSGAALGLPANSRIDALAFELGGHLVISLNVPVTVAGNTYQPNDLVKITGTSLSLYWSGTSAGVPANVNVVGAEVLANNELLVSFDAPVTLAGTTFMPGDIVAYSGGFLATPWFHDASFPSGAAMTDFALPGSPGSVPDGSASTTPLRIAKSGAKAVLTWGSACSTEATGYGVYEGIIGTWYSHSALSCLTGPATTITLSGDALSGNRYFLIVPTNGDYEGSYGKDSSGNPIPPGISKCRAVSDPSPCS